MYEISINTRRNVKEILGYHERYTDKLNGSYSLIFPNMKLDICFNVKRNIYEILQVYLDKGIYSPEYKFQVRVNGILQEHPEETLKSLLK